MAKNITEFLVEQFSLYADRVEGIATRASTDQDPESLHDFRVQLRRLSAALRTARPVFGKFHMRGIEKALDDLIDMTNPVRDAEVLIPLLRAAPLEESLRTALKPALARWETSAQRARTRLRAALAQDALNRPLLWLKALLILPVKSRKLAAADDYAQKIVTDLGEKFAVDAAAIPDKLEDIETAHAVRLKAKQLRYVVDFYTEVLPQRLQKLEPPAKKLQNALGQLHDHDVLRERLIKIHGLAETDREVILTWLDSERKKQAEEAREIAISATEDLEKASQN